MVDLFLVKKLDPPALCVEERRVRWSPKPGSGALCQVGVTLLGHLDDGQQAIAGDGQVIPVSTLLLELADNAPELLGVFGVEGPFLVFGQNHFQLPDELVDLTGPEQVTELEFGRSELGPAGAVLPDAMPTLEDEEEDEVRVDLVVDDRQQVDKVFLAEFVGQFDHRHSFASGVVG